MQKTNFYIQKSVKVKSICTKDHVDYIAYNHMVGCALKYR